MRKCISTFCLTLILLLMLDGAVAVALHLAQQQGKLGSVIRYFEYGRSVTGKLYRWQSRPDAPENLFDYAWLANSVASSERSFAMEAAKGGPVVRSYGMSFVNQILRAARKTRPDLHLDLHSGPGAPPNFTYTFFHDDRSNRRSGDVVVFGILSSSIPALAALSNRTWAFEQPAPYTYPVYYPDGHGLRQVDPLVNSAEEERALIANTKAAQDWARQLAEEDFFFSQVTFGWAFLDHSPFFRLLRRSLAARHVNRKRTDIIVGQIYPYSEVIQRMIAVFTKTAREDGQIPVILLVQSRDPEDVDVLSVAKPILERDNVHYLATVEHFDPANRSGFVPDGHYKPAINERFGEAFVELLEKIRPQYVR